MVEWVEPHRWVSRELITAGKLNTHTDAILWLKENLGAGTFLGLTDTPDSYSGHGGKVVVVKTTEDGLDFASMPGVGPHDKTLHRSPTLPDDDVHRVGDPIDHPDGSIPPPKLKAVNTPTHGQVPSYDGETGRFKWATPTVVDWMGYYRSGKWYRGLPLGGELEDEDLMGLNLWAWPFFVPVETTWNGIGAYASLGASSYVRMGIYADTGNVYPGTLILQTTVGQFGPWESGVSWDIDITLSPGLYWLVIFPSSTVTLRGLPLSNAYTCMGAEWLGGAHVTAYYIYQPWGDLPNPYPSGASTHRKRYCPALRKA